MQEENRKQWLKNLVLQYGTRLRRYAARFVGQEESAEVVQEAFTRLWGDSKPDLVGREREWLFCVCRNLAIDSLRKSKRVKLQEEEGIQIPVSEQLLVKNESDSELAKAITKLSPLQKDVLRLKFQEDLSYIEIAHITGKSVSHIGVILHQSLRALKAQIAEGKRGKGK